MRDNNWPWLARLFAFVIVAFAAIFAFVSVEHESTARTNALKVERERVGNVFLGTLAQGSVDGCISTNDATYVDRAQLLDAIPNAKPQYDQLVKDGTLTRAQADRLLSDAQKQIDRYLARRKYRDCEKAALRYLKLISNGAYKSEQTASVRVKAQEASRGLKRQEAADERRRG